MDKVLRTNILLALQVKKAIFIVRHNMVRLRSTPYVFCNPVVRVTAACNLLGLKVLQKPLVGLNQTCITCNDNLLAYQLL